MNIELQDSTFKQLRDFVYERTGIYIPDVKKYLLESRLIKRVQEKNLNGFEDYLYLIRYNGGGGELAIWRVSHPRPASRLAPGKGHPRSGGSEEAQVQ